MSDLYRDADPNPEKVGRTIYPREAAAEQRWVVKVEPPAKDAYLQWVIPGEIPEYAPVFEEGYPSVDKE